MGHELHPLWRLSYARCGALHLCLELQILGSITAQIGSERSEHLGTLAVIAGTSVITVQMFLSSSSSLVDMHFLAHRQRRLSYMPPLDYVLRGRHSFWM